MYQKIFGDRGATAGMDADNDGEVHQDYSETFSGTDVTKEYIAKLSFEEAFLGTTIQIQFRYVGVCVKCDGSRSELGYTGTLSIEMKNERDIYCSISILSKCEPSSASDIFFM